MADTKITGLTVDVPVTTDVIPYVSDPSGSPVTKKALVSSLVREKLTAARTYYVRTDGADSNTGLANTAGGAFLTVQKAINEALNLDARTYQVTIQVVAGTYTAGISITAAMHGTLPLIIVGDATTPANCKITTTSANAIVVSGNSNVTIQGFQIKTITAGYGLYVTGGIVNAGNIAFDACATCHQQIGEGATLTWFDDYSIIGSSPIHLHTPSVCVWQTSVITVTLTGTPAFSSFFTGAAECATQYWANVTFSGSATGQRYFVHKNSVIDCGGGAAETFLPGDVAGVVSSGGKYIGDDTYADAIQIGHTYTAVTFQNSWVNLAAGWMAVGYTKDQFSRVKLRGTAKNGTVTASIFTLPTGYRPSATLIFPVVSNGALGLCVVNTDGTVMATSGNNTYFSVDGIEFSV